MFRFRHDGRRRRPCLNKSCHHVYILWKDVYWPSLSVLNDVAMLHCRLDTSTATKVHRTSQNKCDMCWGHVWGHVLFLVWKSRSHFRSFIVQFTTFEVATVMRTFIRVGQYFCVQEAPKMRKYAWFLRKPQFLYCALTEPLLTPLTVQGHLFLRIWNDIVWELCVWCLQIFTDIV